MTCEGWWGDYAPVKKDEGAASKGQKQAPVAPVKPDAEKTTTLTVPKLPFGPRK